MPPIRILIAGPAAEACAAACSAAAGRSTTDMSDRIAGYGYLGSRVNPRAVWSLAGCCGSSAASTSMHTGPSEK